MRVLPFRRKDCTIKIWDQTTRQRPGSVPPGLHQDWSEWRDSNSRPPAPEAGALPGCATLRHWSSYCNGFPVRAQTSANFQKGGLRYSAACRYLQEARGLTASATMSHGKFFKLGRCPAHAKRLCSRPLRRSMAGGAKAPGTFAPATRHELRKPIRCRDFCVLPSKVIPVQADA